MRSALLVSGGLLTIAGGIFAIVGFVSLFGAIGMGAEPTMFWCVFVGMPLLAVGILMLKFGLLGTIARYVAGETAPVATDAFNYVAEGSKSGIRAATSAVVEGLTGDAPAMRCPSCGTENAPDARFCDQCGTTMTASVACRSCGGENDANARFCDSCGQALA